MAVKKTTAELLSYDHREVELGLKPWSSLGDFIKDENVKGYTNRVGQALSDINRRAVARFLDPNTQLADFERPILFLDDDKPLSNGAAPPKDSEHVLIAMDALYDFIESDIFNRSGKIPPGMPDIPPYWREVGPGTLDVMIRFVNHAITSATPPSSGAPQ